MWSGILIFNITSVMFNFIHSLSLLTEFSCTGLKDKQTKCVIMQTIILTGVCQAQSPQS